MCEDKEGGNLLKYVILEMFSIVRDDLLGNPKKSNVVVKENVVTMSDVLFKFGMDSTHLVK